MRLPPLALSWALILSGLLLATAPACELPPSADPAPVDLGPLPDDSLYQLGMTLTDQRGQAVDLGLHRGHPTLVTMFYGSCPAACPMLIADMKAIEEALPPAVREELRVVMVSFDPEVDRPEVLAGLAREHGLDEARWTLASSHPDEVRSLAAVLGISYRRLDSGHYNHSAVITLLDSQGRPTARIDGLGQPASPILAALSP